MTKIEMHLMTAEDMDEFADFLKAKADKERAKYAAKEAAFKSAFDAAKERGEVYGGNLASLG